MTNPDRPSHVDELGRQALEKVEAELAELEPQFEALATRLMNLRQASVSLRQLLSLGPPDQGHEPGWRSSEARNRDLEALRRLTREAELAAKVAAIAAKLEAAEATLGYGRLVEGAEAAFYASLADATNEPTSTSRVIELLREANGHSLTNKQIHEAFELRGWIDPRWRQPEAAIRMAIRRAGEQPGVVRIGPSNWAYRGSVAASTEEGGA